MHMNKIFIIYIVIASICIGVMNKELRDLQKQVDMHQEIIEIHNNIFENTNDVLDFIIDKLNLNYTNYGKRMPTPKGT